MDKITKSKLKRCEKSQGPDARALSKISCKIGGHFETAHINSGSSISIASADLYRKLVADKCTFKDGTTTLHLIDESIPNQAYRVTTTTVKVIGKSKSINLVTFPDKFIQRTILGMDFLRDSNSSNTKSKDDAVFRVPEKPAPKSNPVHLEEIVDEEQDDDQPITLLDWIFNTDNLKKPLYNILADQTADDEDLFAICAFMKRMPRMVSPIRSLEEILSCKEKQVNVKLNETSCDKVDGADALQNPTIASKTPMNPEATTSKTSIPSVSLNKPKEMDINPTSMNQTPMSRTSVAEVDSLDKANEKFVDSSSKDVIITSKPSAELTSTISINKAVEKVISSSSTNQADAPKMTTAPLERVKEKIISSSSMSEISKARTSAATPLDKEKSKVTSSSSRNQTTTSSTSLISLEKEREKILSLLSKSEITTPRTTMESTTFLGKPRDKSSSSSSSSKSHSSTSRISSSTSLYKQREKDISSSSRKSTSNSFHREKERSSLLKNPTTTSRASASSSSISFGREKERAVSSSLKNPNTADREQQRTASSLLKNPKPSTLDKAKENERSANNSHQVSLLKSNQVSLLKSTRP